MELRLTYDPTVDAAYLYFSRPKRGSVDFTHPWDDDDETGVAGDVMIDVGHDRKLVGIEFLGASKVLPAEVLAEAQVV